MQELKDNKHVRNLPFIIINIYWWYNSKRTIAYPKQTVTMQTEVCVNYLNYHVHVPSKHRGKQS